MPKTEPTADAKLLADRIEREGLCGLCDPAPLRSEVDLIVDALRRYVLPREALLKAVDDEPELPGAMPPEMWSALLAALMKGERDTVEEMVRIAVRQTKQGIRTRIAACISNGE